MITCSTKLENPFYFIKDNVLYEINNKQDEYNRGLHLVTYLTETKVLSKGEKYKDLHNDEQIVGEDGEYQVSTNRLNIEECKKIFPYHILTFEDDNNNQFDVVLWLQNFIKDGDTIENGAFKTSYGTSYDSCFIMNFSKEVDSLLKKEFNITQILQKIPYYAFNPNGLIENKVTIDTEEGMKKVTYKSCSHGFTISKPTIKQMVLNCVTDKTIAYANSILQKYNMKLKEESIEITKDIIEDI